MKKMKLMLTAGLLCTSTLLLSSFTDSTYQKNGSSSYTGPGSNVNQQAHKNRGEGSWYDTQSTNQPQDRFEINVFDQNDEQALYETYGYSRGDMHHVYKYNFDTKTVETFRGTVEKVMRAKYPDGNCYVLIILRADDGDYLVNLGPVWFIDENGLVINEGDTLQVRGSKVRMNGRYIVIAGEVKKDGEVLKFRDVQGQPTWGNQPGSSSYLQQKKDGLEYGKKGSSWGSSSYNNLNQGQGSSYGPSSSYGSSSSNSYGGSANYDMRNPGVQSNQPNLYNARPGNQGSY